MKAWREAGYPGMTSITKRLLEHWRDPEEFEGRRFFFWQLEAVETLVWLTEAPPAERVGIEVPGDGRDFARRCCKMATGSGKTLVMAMVIAWHLLNKVVNPQDACFSEHVLVVAPGLTVKKRLAVLELAAEGNSYHFPEEHRRRLHSTHTLERLQGELERRSQVVGIFPDRAALLRLVGLLWVEKDDEWAVAERRYFSQESMRKLAEPEAAEDRHALRAMIARG